MSRVDRILGTSASGCYSRSAASRHEGAHQAPVEDHPRAARSEPHRRHRATRTAARVSVISLRPWTHRPSGRDVRYSRRRPPSMLERRLPPAETASAGRRHAISECGHRLVDVLLTLRHDDRPGVPAKTGLLRKASKRSSRGSTPVISKVQPPSQSLCRCQAPEDREDVRRLDATAKRQRRCDLPATGATGKLDQPTSEKEDVSERNHLGQRSGVRGSRRARHARAVRPARGSRHRRDDPERAGTPPQRAGGDGARAHRRPRPSRERATRVRADCKRPRPSTREPSNREQGPANRLRRTDRVDPTR